LVEIHGHKSKIEENSKVVYELTIETTPTRSRHLGITRSDRSDRYDPFEDPLQLWAVLNSCLCCHVWAVNVFLGDTVRGEVADRGTILYDRGNGGDRETELTELTTIDLTLALVQF